MNDKRKKDFYFDTLRKEHECWKLTTTQMLKILFCWQQTSGDKAGWIKMELCGVIRDALLDKIRVSI